MSAREACLPPGPCQESKNEVGPSERIQTNVFDIRGTGIPGRFAGCNAALSHKLRISKSSRHLTFSKRTPIEKKKKPFSQTQSSSRCPFWNIEGNIQLLTTSCRQPCKEACSLGPDPPKSGYKNMGIGTARLGRCSSSKQVSSRLKANLLSGGGLYQRHLCYGDC